MAASGKWKQEEAVKRIVKSGLGQASWKVDFYVGLFIRRRIFQL